jgi:hypothetical protein
VSIAVQEPPAGRRSKRTESTPEPPGSELLAETATVAETKLPSAGVVRVALGAVLSTRRFATVAEVVWLPATSVTVTRRS